MKNRILTFILALFAATAFAQIPTDFGTGLVQAQVMAVHDGDSYKVKFKGSDRTEWVRLVGVDAPEVISPYILKAQPYGRAAGDSVRAMLKGTTVYLDTLSLKNSRDQYGRLLAEVYTQDSTFLPLFLVENGFAWASQVSGRKNPGLNKLLREAQGEAKAAKRGFWALPGRALRPDTWRDKYKRS